MMHLNAREHRVILTYGRFDTFGQGHISFLRQLANRGEEIIVGCATDEFAARIGQPCRASFETRRAILQSCRYVSRVIPEESSHQKRTDIVNYNASTLAMGSEWVGICDDLQDVAKIVYLPRAELTAKKAVFSGQINLSAAM